MINVSEATKTAFKSDGVHKEFVVNIGAYTYTNSDIVDGSISIMQSIFDGDSLDVCGCISSKFEVKIWVPEMGEGQGYPILPVRGEPVTLKVTAGNTDQISVFTGLLDDVDANATNDFITYTAYDMFYTLSGQANNDNTLISEYDITSWFNEHSETTIGTLLTQLCSKFNIQIDSSAPALDCSSITTKCGSVHKVSNLSALDLFKDIFRANGCFGYFTGDGKLSWKYLVTNPYDVDGTLYPSGYLFPSDDLYPGEDPSQGAQNDPGFIAEYENLSYKTYQIEPVNYVVVADYENDSNKGTAGTTGKPNKYKMYGNVCLLGASSGIKNSVASKLLTRLRDIFYAPYEAKCLALPFFEIGDSITLYDARKQKYLRTFILNRSMTVGQHMTDTYQATGNQYLKEFIVGTEKNTGGTSEETQEQIDDINNQIEDIDTNIDNLNTNLSDLTDDYGDFKDYVNDYIDSGGGGGMVNIVTVPSLPAKLNIDTIYLVQGPAVIL